MTLVERAPFSRCFVAREHLIGTLVKIPTTHATENLNEVAQAHAILDANEQVGKVIPIVDPKLAQSLPGHART